MNTEDIATYLSCVSSAINLQKPPNIIENVGLNDNSTQFSISNAIFPILKI